MKNRFTNYGKEGKKHMRDVRIIIVDTGKLESIIIDGVEMEDISSIRDKPIQDWFRISDGRDGWEGLIGEIRKIIDDEEVGLNFEFQGPKERKAIFENCVRELGISIDVNGQSVAEIARWHMKEGKKFEHRGFFKQAYEEYLIAADYGNLKEAQYIVGDILYQCFQGKVTDIGIEGQDALARAIKYYEKLAQGQHYRAQLKLYEIFSERKNWKEAIYWLKAAAANEEQDNTDAVKRLAECYLYGQGIEQDRSEAFRLYNKVADKKDAEVCYILGDFCFYGWGTSPKIEDAVKWYEKAAEQRRGVFPGKAQKALADIFFKGQEVAKNIEKAAYWGEILSDNQESDQNAYGAYIVGECYADGYKAKGDKKNKEAQIEWYEKAANRGYVEAMVLLADDITYNIEGDPVKKEDVSYTINVTYEMTEQALTWYKKAADQGNVLAMIRLADYYDDIDGSEEQALEWYKKAGEKNSTWAMFKTAQYYEKGIGTKKDCEEALRWYVKAAKAGEEEAVFSAAELLASGYDMEEDANIFRRCLQLAEQGNPKAMAAAAKLYASGKGTEQNGQAAIEWYQKAADDKEHPDPEACFVIACLYAQQITEENGNKINKTNRNIAYLASVFAGVCPVTSWVTIPTAAVGVQIAAKVTKDQRYKKSLATDAGKTMMDYYRKAAQLGYEDAEKALKKWEKYL